MSDDFVEYQKQVLVNANAMAEEFIERGFDVVSGGTDDHLFLLSLISKGLTGKDADAALSKAHITVNKNSVPNDPQSPFVTSGLRIGSPAITTRGFNEQDSRDLTHWICDVLENMNDDDVIATVRAKVTEICARLPVYKD
jgi:glycine hydroxymethyltransferase